MIHFSESVNCKQLALFGTPKYLLIKKCNKTLEYTGWLKKSSSGNESWLPIDFLPGNAD